MKHPVVQQESSNLVLTTFFWQDLSDLVCSYRPQLKFHQSGPDDLLLPDFSKLALADSYSKNLSKLVLTTFFRQDFSDLVGSYRLQLIFRQSGT